MSGGAGGKQYLGCMRQEEVQEANNGCLEVQEETVGIWRCRRQAVDIRRCRRQTMGVCRWHKAKSGYLEVQEEGYLHRTVKKIYVMILSRPFLVPFLVRFHRYPLGTRYC